MRVAGGCAAGWTSWLADAREGRFTLAALRGKLMAWRFRGRHRPGRRVALLGCRGTWCPGRSACPGWLRLFDGSGSMPLEHAAPQLQVYRFRVACEDGQAVPVPGVVQGQGQLLQHAEHLAPHPFQANYSFLLHDDRPVGEARRSGLLPGGELAYSPAESFSTALLVIKVRVGHHDLLHVPGVPSRCQRIAHSPRVWHRRYRLRAKPADPQAAEKKKEALKRILLVMQN